jgi:hypothetical protein
MNGKVGEMVRRAVQGQRQDPQASSGSQYLPLVGGAGRGAREMQV